jgi:transposase
VDNAITEPVRRLEVFTGGDRRRKWSDEDKARIVAEIEASGDSICALARRHGLSPQQLFGWRRQLREAAVGYSDAEDLQAVCSGGGGCSVPAPARGRHRQTPRCKPRLDIGTIEVEVGGVTIRAGHGADANLICGDCSGAKGAPVIGPTGAVRVMVATKPVDFRKGVEGLAMLVRESMTSDPFSGNVYVFRAKRADRIKLIFWDGTASSAGRRSTTG